MANTPFQIVGAQGGSVVPLGASDRRHRRPKFKFNLKAKPYAITPFMIAPVLPGETLQSVWHESREVSDTLVDPLIGWKLERYWFYVQIRDLNERDQLEVLFTDPVNGDISALNSAADSKYYHNGGSPNFLKMCLQRVVETYFRDEGETWNTHTIDGYPAAQFRDVQWMDSLLDDTAVDDEGAGIGTVTAGGSLQELQEQLTIFQTLQAMNMTSGTFEDYLRAQGVSFDREKLHYPELIASETEWVYPANTVDPATGSPSSAISHVSKGVKRDRKKFDEPGFVIGVYVPRPKLYYERQFGSVAHS